MIIVKGVLHEFCWCHNVWFIEAILKAHAAVILLLDAAAGACALASC
jgi:hypothetical protein